MKTHNIAGLFLTREILRKEKAEKIKLTNLTDQMILKDWSVTQ